MTTYNQKERRFTTVLILIYALLSCGVIAGSILLYRSEYASLLADDSKELLSIVELKAKQITDYRKERFSEANFVYENASFMEDVLSFRSNPRSPKFEVQLDNWLLPILNNHNYESIKIIDTGGVILYAIGRYDKRHVERMFHFGKQSLNENKISFGNLVLHEADTSYHLEIFVPLTLKSSGEKIGVVNFTIDPQIELFDLMQSWPIESRTAEVLVVRKEGDDVIFQNELRFKKNTALKLKYPINTKDLPAARAARGETKVMIGIDYKGHEVLAAGKQIPNSDWIVIAKIDMEEVLEPRTSKTFFILAMMTALLMALSSAFFILRRAIRMHEMKVEIQFVIAVKRLNRVYQVLSNVNQAIVRISDRDELLNEICRIAIDDGGFRLCWIGFIDRETGIIDPAAKAGPAVKYLDKIKFTSERDLLSGDGPNGKTLRSGQYVIQNDLWKSARMAPWGDRARKYKLKSSASFPLMQNNVTIGAVSLYADQFNFFTSDEIRLLQELSADLSYALSNIDRDKISKISEQALRESEDRYRDLVENSLDI
ncbi:GAF domain-containing protein, partial [bacterium]|nr:GAF domain-containing protein [bacterium]